MAHRHHSRPYNGRRASRGQSRSQRTHRARLRDWAMWGVLGFAGFIWAAGKLGSEPERQALSFSSAATENVYYRRCADARSAGAAPIYRGEPGYRGALDADNDGIACEPYYGN